VFAIIAGIGSYLLYQGSSGAAAPMMAAGVVAIILSLLLFGGIFGIIEGVLSLGAGIKAYSPARAYFPAPPPYFPPPSRPPRAPP
jgi:hypothetical protein